MHVPVLFFFRFHAIGRLYVITSASKITDEIDFEIGALLFAVFIFRDNRDNSYIHIESSHTQFIVNQILHQMTFSDCRKLIRALRNPKSIK